MQRHTRLLLTNWVLFLGGSVAFSTGLILLFRFHMGPGAWATTALGVDRLVWLNMHRCAVVLIVPSLLVHIGLHWRPFRARIVNTLTRPQNVKLYPDLILYATFFCGAATGLISWWMLEGSTPVFGPAAVGRLVGMRHLVIDVHHLSSLVSLGFTAHHLRHRWRRMVSPPCLSGGRVGGCATGMRRCGGSSGLPPQTLSPSRCSPRC